MKSPNHTVTLGMETHSLDSRDPKDGTNLHPDQGRELEPLSEARRAGTPNLKAQVEMKALAQASAVMEDSLWTPLNILPGTRILGTGDLT